MESRAGGTTASSASRKSFSRSNSDVAGYEKNDGSVSDSALSSSVTESRKRRPSLGYKVAALVGLSKKSSSTSQLAGQGGSIDAQDQSEAQYLPPEGHVIVVGMGSPSEMSSFNGTGGSLERGGSSFDRGMGLLTQRISFDQVVGTLDKGSESTDRGNTTLDKTEGCLSRPSRSVDRGSESVGSRTRSEDRTGSFERAGGPRLRREGAVSGRQMPGFGSALNGMTSFKQNLADSLTSGYGGSSTGSAHGANNKSFGKEGVPTRHNNQIYGVSTQNYGQDYGTSGREYGSTEQAHGTSEQGYGAVEPNFGTTGQRYCATTQVYGTPGYGAASQANGAAAQGYSTNGYSATDQGYDTTAQAYQTNCYVANSQPPDACGQDYGAVQSFGTGVCGATRQDYGPYSQVQMTGSSGSAAVQADAHRDITRTSTTSTTGIRTTTVKGAGNGRLGATSPSAVGRCTIPLGSKATTDQDDLFSTLGSKHLSRSPTTPIGASVFGGSTNGNKGPADIFSQPRAQSQGPRVGSIVEMGSGILSKGLQSFKSFF